MQPGIGTDGVRASESLLHPDALPQRFDQGGPAEQFFEADARQALEDAEEVANLAESIIRPS